MKQLTTAWAACLVISAAGLASAETVEGQITRVELRDSPRHIMVRTSDGEIQQRIANRTHVIFDPSEAGYFPNSELSDLQPGMQVRFDRTDDVLDRLRVVSVPPNLRPKIDKAPERSVGAVLLPPVSSSRPREVRARVTGIDDRRGELRTEVDGRRQTFRVESTSQLRRVEIGDTVLLSVERRDGDDVVTSIRSGAESRSPSNGGRGGASKLQSGSGRVRDVARGEGRVWIDVDGHQEQFRVDDKRLLDDLRIGDRVRFDYEERSNGQRVISDVH
jgi:Cu/Ag efflux protein CusF